MNTATATVTSKGQVTLPVRVRRHLGIHQGQIVIFTCDGRGHAQIKVAEKAKDKLEGCLKSRIPKGLRPPTVEEMDMAIARHAGGGL